MTNHATAAIWTTIHKDREITLTPTLSLKGEGVAVADASVRPLKGEGVVVADASVRPLKGEADVESQ